MNSFIIIIGLLLIILAIGHFPAATKYRMSSKTLLYLILVTTVFSIICLRYSFRRKSKKYGYASIGGFRGFI